MTVPPSLSEPIRSREASWLTIVAFLLGSMGLLLLLLLARTGPLGVILGGPMWRQNLVLFAILLVVAVGPVIFGFGRLRPRHVGLERSKLMEGMVTVAAIWVLIQLIPALIEIVLTGTVELHPSWQARGAQQIILWAGAMFLGVALFEEIAYRGFLFPQMYLKLPGSHRTRFWSAVLLSQAAFALMHVPGHIIIRELSGSGLMTTVALQGFAGFLMLLAYLRTRNLWIAIGVHGLVNAPTPLVVNALPWEIFLPVLLVAWPWLARRPEHRGLARVEREVRDGHAGTATTATPGAP